MEDNMIDLKSVSEKIAVGAGTFVLIAILTLAWNWFSDGGIIRALSGLSKRDKLEFSTITFPFSNLHEAAEIPGSEGAVLCALTHVDDDSPVGSCTITRDDKKHWLVSTGGNGGDNACAATCLLAN
jgi:hypothetical protein